MELEPTIRKKKEWCFIERVLVMYDWKTAVENFKIKIDNCWATRQCVEAPHAFIYKNNEDLTKNEMDQIKDVIQPGVYALVKQNMSDAKLAQAPMLAMPRSIASTALFPPVGQQSC